MPRFLMGWRAWPPVMLRRRRRPRKAQRVFYAEAPLLLLLQAQTARLQGNIPAMQRYYKVLSADKDAGFLGISGALRSALERQDLHAAAQLIEDGLKSHPRSPLLLQEAQSLALSQQDWDKALAVIKTQQAQKIISKAEAKAAMSTVLTQQADSLSDDKAAQAVALKKALKLTPKSPQLLYRLKDYLTHRQMKAKVLAAWQDRSTPQPERLLAQLWLEILPQSKNPLSSVKWAKQLIRGSVQRPPKGITLLRACWLRPGCGRRLVSMLSKPWLWPVKRQTRICVYLRTA